MRKVVDHLPCRRRRSDSLRRVFGQQRGRVADLLGGEELQSHDLQAALHPQLVKSFAPATPESYPQKRWPVEETIVGRPFQWGFAYSSCIAMLNLTSMIVGILNLFSGLPMRICVVPCRTAKNCNSKSSCLRSTIFGMQYSRLSPPCLSKNALATPSSVKIGRQLPPSGNVSNTKPFTRP